jgi:hypothetical protein
MKNEFERLSNFEGILFIEQISKSERIPKFK